MNGTRWSDRKDRVLANEIRRLIVKHRGNVQRAARELAVEPGFFRRLVKRHGLVSVLHDARDML